MTKKSPASANVRARVSPTISSHNLKNTHNTHRAMLDELVGPVTLEHQVDQQKVWEAVRKPIFVLSGSLLAVLIIWTLISRYVIK